MLDSSTSAQILTASDEHLSSFNSDVQRHLRRNIIFHILDGGVFFVGFTLISFETVIPVFITKLGGNNFAVSLVPFLWLISANIGAVLVARHVEQTKRKMIIILVLGLIMRLPWLVLGVVMLVTGVAQASILIPATVAALLIYGLFDGLSLTPFFDLVGRAVPVRVRGRALSARMVLGYGLGILGGFAVERILVLVPFPQNYAVLFLLAFGFMLLSLVFIAAMKEPVYPLVIKHASTALYIKKLFEILKTDSRFLHFNISRAFLMLLFSTSAFYSAYGIRHLALPDSYAGIFTVIVVISCMVISPILGYFGDKKGHKKNLLIAMFAPSISASIALFSTNTVIYCSVFTVTAIVQIAYFVSIENMILEYSKPEQRPSYIALSGVIMIPVGFLTLMLGGIADWMGYKLLFSIIIGLSVIGTAYAGINLQDPTGRSK